MTNVVKSQSPQKETRDKSFISPNSKRSILQKRIDNFIGKNIGTNRVYSSCEISYYSIFTSLELSNLVAISPNPLSGPFLSNNFSSKQDILRQSSKFNVLEFDLVYNEQYEIEKIYLDNIKDKITSLFKGISSTLFFFGPSESGKSYYSRGNKEDQGMIDYTIRDIFRLINNEGEKQNCVNIFISISNIFEGRINDLLSFNSFKKEGLVENLIEREINSRNEMFVIINEALKRRKIIEEESSVNEFSVRSHFIISLIIKVNKCYLSQIDFVELASSQYVLGDSDLINNNKEEINSLQNLIINFNNNNVISCSTKLDTLLRNHKARKRKMIFFNCVIPNGEVLFDSSQSLKFSQNLREIMKTNCINNIRIEKNITSEKDSFNEEDDRYIRTEENEEKYINKDREMDNNKVKLDKEDKIKKTNLQAQESLNVEDIRIQEIERSLLKLDQKSKNITDTLESLRKEKVEGKLLFNKELSNSLVESLRNEIAILKSDNIIFREEINKLNDFNNHLESELIKQRNRNYELAADYERILQDNLTKDRELEKLSIEVYKYMKSGNEYNDLNNLRFQMDLKIKELEIENKTLSNDKQKLEIELKLSLDKYNELSKKYDTESKELSFMKIKQSEDMNLLDTKVERMSREIENLQRENNNSRLNEEKIRLELLNAEKQRDIYRDKYHNCKARNTSMSSKLLEIETEFKEILEDKERENQSILMKRSEESQKKLQKYESKQKLIEEMQNRIYQFKTGFIQKRYFNKNNESN